MKKIINTAFISLIIATGIMAVVMDKSSEDKEKMLMNQTDNLNKATFAGGCFWCLEPPFEMLEGVVEVIAGYTGGHKDNPTYEEVLSGRTGHFEAVQVIYDP